MKEFISVENVTNLDSLVKAALEYKLDPFKDKKLGENKRLGLLFLNPSMRTRISTQVAAMNLGMDVIVLNAGNDSWALEFDDEAIMKGSTVEHVKEAAPILGKYFDILGVRTFPSLKNKEEDYSEHLLKQFIRYSGIPVVSLESATLHPLQSLTDIVTIKETFKEKRKPKIVLTWAPHVKALPQCVANSFSQWVNRWGESEFVITHPKGYELDEKFTRGATIINDQASALKNADYVYIKNWSAYHDYGKIIGDYPEWMLTPQKLSVTKSAKVMHCLPVRRNLEISGEVLDGANSLVVQQASNRVCAAQAVVAEILKGG